MDGVILSGPAIRVSQEVLPPKPGACRYKRENVYSTISYDTMVPKALVVSR
jgi:hypothetical protein